jgi:hypothetical protein
MINTFNAHVFRIAFVQLCNVKATQLFALATSYKGNLCKQLLKLRQQMKSTALKSEK